jgi:acyl carrier protein
MPRRATADEITDWSRDHIAQTLSRPRERIDPDAKLSRHGLDSATSVQLMIALEEWLDIELAPELAMEHQTLRKLSVYIAGLLANETG